MAQTEFWSDVGGWRFDSWNRIIRRGRAEQWSGRQTSSTFRTVRHGWWADETARLGDLPTGSVVVQWLVEKLHAGRNPGTRATEDIRPPQYATPSFYAGVYLDLKSAYWSVFRHLTWDCEFAPGGYLALGKQWLADFPYAGDKLARNSVVGCAASRQILLWNNGLARPRRRRGGLWNPNLCGYVWAVLGAVAWRCWDLGARYWNLDGAIVPWRYAEAAKMWSEEHGLNLREKSQYGFAHIKAVGAYSMPGKQTRGFARIHEREHFSLPPRAVCDHAISTFAEIATG